MKELYTTPEIKLISFMAEERLASATDEEFLLSEKPEISLDTDISIEFD